MKIFCLICMAAGLGLLGANSFFGREFLGSRRRMELPPSVRQTPGGYRTFLHNHGFRGGK